MAHAAIGMGFQTKGVNMVRNRSLFVCQQCGNETGKWHGKCPTCGEWGSLVETARLTGSKKKVTRTKQMAKPIKLSSVKTSATKRTPTKISELDRVLGGGLVDGQVILVAGEPGVGKSTILLQVADKLNNTIYVSGEESVSQLKIRANRMGIGKSARGQTVRLLEEIDVDIIVDTIENSNVKGPTVAKAVIIDSIQTMSTSDLTGMAGSVGQVRECAYRLVRLAKSSGVSVFLVGHVTKQGSVAGPSVLMHLVDTVLWFEGDQKSTLRLLRCVKNRFGATDEVGVFEMGESGLKSLSNPNKIFLTKGKAVAGSVVTSIMHGTRPLLVEVQALCVPTKLAFPRRVAQGIDNKRFELLLAVLTKHANLKLFNYDCYVNIAGGISVKEPSADLAVCMAVASSYFDKAVATNTIVVGEIGLLGDIREVVGQDRRVKEAKRLGYKTVVSSKEVKYLNQAIKKYINSA